eukprot:snap_masked-scaffold_28-processed-gene-0.14-mRNA-1 protein AED:1.00 eAED:1.00 QI:0/0/0/0/1/1/2/0/69
MQIGFFDSGVKNPGRVIGWVLVFFPACNLHAAIHWPNFRLAEIAISKRQTQQNNITKKTTKGLFVWFYI